MRQQVVRIIDPNYTFQNRLASQIYDMQSYREEGRNLISFLRANGVDKSVRDGVRAFISESAQKVSKKEFHNEVTKYGNPSYIGGGSSSSLGFYNPDTIPVETYVRMKTDPQVAIGLAMIKLPIYSLGWLVDCEDHDIKEFVREAVARIWRRLLVSMLTAIDFGFASHEIVWELTDIEIATMAAGRKKTHFSGKAELIKKLKLHYPASVRIRADATTDEFIGITQQTPGGGLVSLDSPKCFLFSMNDEFGNFFGTPRLKAAYKPWYWKEVLTQFMLRYFERKGSPSTVVTHPIGGGVTLSGTEYDNTEIALRIGQNLVENSVVTLPFDSNKEGKNQWDVNYLQDDRRGEMFVNALNWLGAQILRGLLTPERIATQDLSTGSFSMASSHAEIFLLSLEGLAAEMQDAINLQIIPKLVEFNFKPKKIIPCTIRIEKIQYDRKRILKEILVEVLRNVDNYVKAGKTPNIVPSIEQMCDVLGVPLATFSDEYIDTGVPSEEEGENINPEPKPGDKKSKVTPINSSKVKKTPVTTK